MHTFAPELHPMAARILGPACAAAAIHLRCPELPAEAAFALVPALGRPEKPMAFASLPDLARRLHRARETDALSLQPARLRFRGETREVVDVTAEDAGGRVRRLGFAWIGGRDWRALAAALEAQVPSATLEDAA